jgi:hypothetical protein
MNSGESPFCATEFNLTCDCQDSDSRPSRRCACDCQPPEPTLTSSAEGVSPPLAQGPHTWLRCDAWSRLTQPRACVSRRDPQV